MNTQNKLPTNKKPYDTKTAGIYLLVCLVTDLIDFIRHIANSLEAKKNSIK